MTQLTWEKNSYTILLIIVAIIAGFILLFMQKADQENVFSTVTVQEGDSLWTLADQYADEHHMSKVDFIKWVENENHLKSASIKSGDPIIIPVKKKIVNNDQQLQQFASNGE
jgi:cell division protein YceG involved in septum cleavage